MDDLRTNDVDAWAKLHRMVGRAQSSAGLEGNHVAPMRAQSDHLIGEIKATGAKMYRLYYGEPDEHEDLVVGLCLREKRTFSRPGATTSAQDRDVRDAVGIFVTWLNANGMRSTR